MAEELEVERTFLENNQNLDAERKEAHYKALMNRYWKERNEAARTEAEQSNLRRRVLKA